MHVKVATESAVVWRPFQPAAANFQGSSCRPQAPVHRHPCRLLAPARRRPCRLLAPARHRPCRRPAPARHLVSLLSIFVGVLWCWCTPAAMLRVERVDPTHLQPAFPLQVMLCSPPACTRSRGRLAGSGCCGGKQWHAGLPQRRRHLNTRCRVWPARARAILQSCHKLQARRITAAASRERCGPVL